MHTDAHRDAFHKAYSALNPQQKKAVDTIDGPVMVMAGPGTGKTQVLTLRIANILQRTDTAPESILALTFTEAGAHAMRSRLLSYIGAEAYRVTISTFHAFADRLIREFPEAYERIIGGNAAHELQKIMLIQSVLETSHARLLRPMGNTSYYIIPIIRMISSLKQENITPDGLSLIIAAQEKELEGIPKIHEKGAHKGKVRGEYRTKERAIEKNRELLTVYRLYDARLREERLYDFDDMIIETIAALLRNEDMLLSLQERYQYVLADEHQDVNNSQNRILELLTSFHPHPNLFVVGDEKQAIYRFQGASLENFLFFENSYPETLQISLADNYRSGQRILDAAHSLITAHAGEAAALRVPLAAVKKEKGEVRRIHFSHQGIEDEYIADAVAALLAQNVPPQEIAVILRTNREVEDLSILLRKKGIRVFASAESDILKHPLFTSLCDLIGAAIGTTDESPLFRSLHASYWEIPRDDLFRIYSSRRYGESLWGLITDEEELRSRGVRNVAAFVHAAEVMEHARSMDGVAAVQRIVEYLCEKSGFLSHALAEEPVFSGKVIRRIYDELEAIVRRDGGTDLTGALRSLFQLKEYNIPLSAPFAEEDDGAVRVLTAHKSKGLEYEHVFLAHACDEVWSAARSRTYFDVPLSRRIGAALVDPSDDERRLFYVALTRAKRSLTLTYADANTEGRSFVPSRFLGEIDAQCFSLNADHADAFDPTAALSAPGAGYDASRLIRTYLLNRGLSVTALNNYLSDPWTFFYKNVLSLPEVQGRSQQFGTAVHDVLQRFVQQSASGEVPDDAQVMRSLENALRKLPLSPEEYAALHRKGLECLMPYCEMLRKEELRGAMTEFSARAMLQTGITDLPELPLTGKLDRLDLDTDGRVVRVVDYKTGKPKSRGVIEGTVKNGDGNYKRQLVFYALLLSLQGNDQLASRRGVLSFVEPDASGKIREEEFSITDAELTSLKSEIVRVLSELLSGTWMDAPTEDSPYRLLAEQLLAEK
jgi:DNA helicase-2/ATP-dependent DNA helicase PcrA